MFLLHLTVDMIARPRNSDIVAAEFSISGFAEGWTRGPMATRNAEQSGMVDALNRLWKQYLPTMEERVAILQKAARNLAGRELSDDERAEANSAAHKLAGVLGTFGLTKGTVLAREAEILYSGDNGTDPENAKQLVKIAEQLRAMIAAR